MLLAPVLGLGLAFNAGCLFQHHANTNPLARLNSKQPDKVLFDAAMADLDKGKYTVARLNLETLLNTYPDSEYLARAKMAIADSWYRQGGVDGLAQAEAQYKDFITFFPAMKEASEAQLKIATIHYKQLQKPDRDPTQAEEAQAELRTFLMNYPTSPLRPQALQMLRDTQEVLADRLYLIGDFYLERAQQGDYADYRAAQSRLEELLEKYPLFSQGDVALDQLAHSYVTTSNRYAGAAKLQPNKQDRDLELANARADRENAVADFTRLARRYPLSPYAKDAVAQLKTLNAPVPTPTPEEVAFNRAEIQGRGKAEKSEGFLTSVGLTGILSPRPEAEILRADKVGQPPLTETQVTQDVPPPGLEQLLRQSMIKTGAIAPNSKGPLPLANAALSAELVAANQIAAADQSATDPSSASGPGSASASASASSGGAPLAFENVPTASSPGADSPLDNAAPQAVTGNNDNDPNGQQAAAAADPNVVLTPNEIDMENQDQILAAEVHRAIPPPAADLKKMMAEHKIKGPARATVKPKVQAPPQKKSLLSRLWP